MIRSSPSTRRRAGTGSAPTGRIPVISDGGFELSDSSVICAYLEETRPEPALFPREAKARARALWLEEYCDGTLFREVIHGLFFQTVIRPKILQQESDRVAIDAILTQALPKILGYLETQIGEGFLVGGRFGIADIALTSNLVNFHYLGYRIDAGRHPRLERYFQRLCRHPSIATALRTEQPVAKNMGLDLSAIDALLAAQA